MINVKRNDMFDVESHVSIHHKLREHIFILSDKASTFITFQNDLNASTRSCAWTCFGNFSTKTLLGGGVQFLKRQTHAVWHNAEYKDSSQRASLRLCLQCPICVPWVKEITYVQERHFYTSHIWDLTCSGMLLLRSLYLLTLSYPLKQFFRLV